MALFLKRGVNRASDQYIYPHPTQTKTGNCAAYTGAACLYAFGLDHQPDLIPSAKGGTEGEQFQYKISKMVEKLTELIYTAWFSSPAEGYRKYINAAGLNCKFDVTEVPSTEYKLIPATARFVWVTNLPYLKQQLRLCQDIMLHISYGGIWGGEYDPFANKHSVGLVGFDEVSGELVLNNPWGSSIHVNPEDAGRNTETGGTENAFTRYKYTIDPDNGTLHFPFDGKDATVYQVIMICPVDHAVAIRSEVRTMETPGQPQAPRGAPLSRPLRRFNYTVDNREVDLANGFAIELPHLGPENVVGMGSPQGWKAALWYRQRERGFDRPAPEVTLDLMKMTFAGVVWRAAEAGGIGRGESLGGFFIEVEFPRRNPECPDQPDQEDEWFEDTLGHGIVLQERDAATTAWHISATTPAKRDLRRRLLEERDRHDTGETRPPAG